MKKIGQIGRLKRECIDEYCRLHEEAVYTPQWAGVLDMIHACNIRNYSIFIEDDVVFAYFEYVGSDYAADMKRMEADPTTQLWWKHTRPCFEKYSPDKQEAFYTDMKQIFNYD